MNNRFKLSLLFLSIFVVSIAQGHKVYVKNAIQFPDQYVQSGKDINVHIQGQLGSTKLSCGEVRIIGKVNDILNKNSIEIKQAGRAKNLDFMVKPSHFKTFKLEEFLQKNPDKKGFFEDKKAPHKKRNILLTVHLVTDKKTGENHYKVSVSYYGEAKAKTYENENNMR